MKQFLDDLCATKICEEEIENLVMIPLKNYCFQAKSSYKALRERRGNFFPLQSIWEVHVPQKTFFSWCVALEIFLNI